MKDYTYTGVGCGYSAKGGPISTRRLGNLIHSETLSNGLYINLTGVDGIGRPSSFPCKSDSGSPAFVDIQTTTGSPTIKAIAGILTQGYIKSLDSMHSACSDTVKFVNLTNDTVQLAVVRTLNEMVKTLKDAGHYPDQYSNSTFPQDTLFIDQPPTVRPKLALTFVVGKSDY